MITIKNCAWCGVEFEQTHGNNGYCSEEHQSAARKDRQKRKRDPIARFLPIMMNNHEVLERLFMEGKLVLSDEEIVAYGIDISLCRHMKPPSEQKGKFLLDFGQFYLLTEPDFLTFTIFKHGTITGVNAN